MRRSLTLLLVLACAPGSAGTQGTDPLHAETVELLRGLVQLDTSNPPGNEILAARYIESILGKAGVRSEIFESAPGRATLVARLPGSAKKRPILLMGRSIRSPLTSATGSSTAAVPSTTRRWSRRT